MTDHFGRYEEAEAAYRKAIEIDPTGKLPFAKLAYLFWLHLNRPHEASAYAKKAAQGMAPCGSSLLEACRALVSDAPGLAWKMVHAAVEMEDPEIWTTYINDLQRILCEVKKRSYGNHFLEWMDKEDYPARFAPLYWAFKALCDGEAVLGKVNPEVRHTAKMLYRGMATMEKIKSAS